MEYPTHLKASQIVSGENPRRHFDDEEQAILDKSIAAQGILQPILLRPLRDDNNELVEGMYKIVAGERRWRSAIKIDPDYKIPVLIRNLTDEEVTAAAANENIIRAAMSPSEEAEVAAKVLAQHNGDYVEAAKRLGWDRATLEKRLSLMQCSQNVRDALTSRKIKLGYAELLATATKEKQDKVLEKLLALTTLPSLSDFKKQIEQISKLLSTAIFDRQECAGCPSNSSNQSQLFVEAISDGYCTNGVCFDKKTASELEVRSEKLKDEYPTVKVINVGQNFTVIRIVPEGATGVGEVQARACRGCANFGAAVSNIPGSIGNTYRDQCFDPACNQTKVAERIKAEKAVKIENAKTAEKSEDTTTVKKPVSKPVVAITDPTKVKEYRLKVWRNILVKELMENDVKNNIVLLSLGICGLGRHISGNKLTKAFNKLTGNDETVLSNKVGKVAELLTSIDDTVKSKLHQALAASVQDDIDEHNLRQLLTYLEADVAKHWQLNKDYLDLMTKSEIELVADELGLKAHIGSEFSKLMNDKKDVFVAKLLKAEGFDYIGKVPKHLAYQIVN